MLHPSTQKLIDRLATMTAQKKLDWIEKDNGDVLYATEGYVVRLTPEPPRILLETEGGKPLEDASESLLKAAPHAEGGTYADLVASIARDACREARGTEHAINTVLGSLSEESEAPAPAEPSADEEEAVDAADTADEPAGLEDAGDETTALLSEDEQERIVDASVPEAAILEPEETGTGEPEAVAEAEGGDTEARAEDDGLGEGDDLGESDDPAGDDEDVGGAVARLADEVNGTAERDTAEETAEPQEAAASYDATEIENGVTEPEASERTTEDTPEPEEMLAASPVPSYGVTPDDAVMPQSFDETDEIADASAGPVETEADTLDEALGEDEDGDNYAGAEAPQAAMAGDEAPETHDDTSSEEDVAVAPVWDAAAPTVEAPEQDDAEEAAIADEIDTPAVASMPRANYMPFGAGGTEVVGAEASDEAPEEADIDAEIPAAATMMTMPETGSDSDTWEPETATEDPELRVAAEAEAQPETPDATDSEFGAHTSAGEPQPVQTDQETGEPVAAFDEPAVSERETHQPAPQNFSLSGAGIGFGATSTGFQPTAPRTPAPVDAAESVRREPVVIDATDDFPPDYTEPVENGLPNVSDLEGGPDVTSEEDFSETSVPQSDIETIEPAEETPESKGLSLVDADGESTNEEEEPAQHARPKTRFNPWT